MAESTRRGYIKKRLQLEILRREDIAKEIVELEAGIAELERQLGDALPDIPHPPADGKSMDAEATAAAALAESQAVNGDDVDMDGVTTKSQPAAEDVFVPPNGSKPIRADVTTFDWTEFASQCQFDVIMMDPPWQLANCAPTRGVALGYSQLSDLRIQSIPIPDLQPPLGLLFVWVINVKYDILFRLFDTWGYDVVDDVAWIKQTVNRRLAKGHGYYLQHAKESCLVARKRAHLVSKYDDGRGMAQAKGDSVRDVLFCERRGQSQKPDEAYEIVEALVPGGRYLEIFGRRNNLRCGWITIGNEL